MKQRIAITLDKDIVDWLINKNYNVSRYVNAFMRVRMTKESINVPHVAVTDDELNAQYGHKHTQGEDEKGLELLDLSDDTT